MIAIMVKRNKDGKSKEVGDISYLLRFVNKASTEQVLVTDKLYVH